MTALTTTSKICITVVICLGSIAVVAPPVFSVTPFVIEVVDMAGGGHASLALDGRGNPSYSYYDFTNGDLIYATKVGDNWTTEIVDSMGDVGQYPSLAMDGQGIPHISYRDETNADLKYAVKTGDGWMTETVESAGDVGKQTSLALDAEGNAHICYNDDDLKYAVKTVGGWALETVDINAGSIYSWYWPSIAVDTEGNPHIAYVSSSVGNIRYAVKEGGSWTLETAYYWPGGWAGYVSLALDVRGNPRISHYMEMDGLSYVAKTDGSWVQETVGTPAYYRTSLALDVEGNPHIGCFDNVAGGLSYVVKTGSGWVVEKVDAVGDVVELSSIVLDAEGNPHIGYYDDGDGNLKYASAAIYLTSPIGGEKWIRGELATVTWEGTGMVDILVSPDGGASYSTSLSAVSGGSAVIGVPAWTTDEARVKIVRNDPNSTSESPGTFTIAPECVSPWWSGVVDAGGGVGLSTSLALAAGGNPHVSYLDLTNGDLKYAVKTGGSWATETVDTMRVVGEGALGLDAQGTPHIGYLDATNNDLRYAIKSDGHWTTGIVDAMGNGHISLALDAEGNPHISYTVTSGHLWHAVKTGGSWNLKAVDATGIFGENTSLALDAQGDPHISYTDLTSGNIKYSVKFGGSWAHDIVDATSLGSFTSLALDAQGNPHISYVAGGNLKYAVKTGDSWSLENVDVTGDVGYETSLGLDAQGDPHISYHDLSLGDLRYAVKTGGIWKLETIDGTGVVGRFNSLALDAQGNPHISYYDGGNSDLKYASGAVEVSKPSGGDTWPVGAMRTVTWQGTGAVDISLSVDGGHSYTPVVSEVSGGSYSIIVPHTPSKFSAVRIERREAANDFGSFVYRHSISESDSFFTIETSITLLAMMASPALDGSGMLVTWNTDPGPEDLDGYRLEKRRDNSGWMTLVSKTKETQYIDREGKEGDRYRLYAINGHGEEFYMGEAGDLAPAIPKGLVLYPIPYRSGDLTIEFMTGTLGGVPVETEVAIYDVRGRMVKKAAIGQYAGGVGQVKWDGRDENGVTVASGIYFVRVSTGLSQHVRKLVIVR